MAAALIHQRSTAAPHSSTHSSKGLAETDIQNIFFCSVASFFHEKSESTTTTTTTGRADCPVLAHSHTVYSHHPLRCLRFFSFTVIVRCDAGGCAVL